MKKFPFLLCLVRIIKIWKNCYLKQTKNIINKTIVNLDDVFFHNNKIVPFVETVHNRLNIEVARGCVGRCRFCQASKYYRPWRARKVDTVLKLLDESLKNTGYE